VKSTALDSQEARRNALAICNQFVIDDPGSGIYLNVWMIAVSFKITFAIRLLR
jgi:hypothetical protein